MNQHMWNPSELDCGFSLPACQWEDQIHNQRSAVQEMDTFQVKSGHNGQTASPQDNGLLSHGTLFCLVFPPTHTHTKGSYCFSVILMVLHKYIFLPAMCTDLTIVQQTEHFGTVCLLCPLAVPFCWKINTMGGSDPWVKFQRCWCLVILLKSEIYL